jgi:hypothetical protein
MSIDLTVEQPLSTTAQFIQDQNGDQSSLAISNSQVCIGTTAPANPSLLTLSSEIGPGPSMVILSAGSEASVAYQDSSQIFWTVGSGGVGAGLQPGTFFFWNSQAGGGVLTIDPTGTVTLLTGGLKVPNGTVSANDIQASSLQATNITASSLTVNVSAMADSAAAPDPSRLVPLAIDPETGKIHLHR